MKKGARKMLIKSAKSTIEAYKDGITERANVPQQRWHADKMNIKIGMGWIRWPRSS